MSCASRSSMNHSCCLAHSCLGASGSGRYGVGQMERPHGGSRCFAFVYAQLIKNNKQCHPGVSAIWETPDNSFSCSLVNYWRAFLKRCELFSGNPLMLHSAAIKTGEPRLLLNLRQQAAHLKSLLQLEGLKTRGNLRGWKPVQKFQRLQFLKWPLEADSKK